MLFDLVRRTLLLPRFGERFGPVAAWWVGLATAAVWMVHPLNTQSVTYVVQRCESMMGVFFLASVWCFLRGVPAISASAVIEGEPAATETVRQRYLLASRISRANAAPAATAIDSAVPSCASGSVTIAITQST